MAGKIRVTDATLDVLEVLLGPDDTLYGFKIAKAAGRQTGTVFPILARLERAGWVSSEWEPGDADTSGPRRRFYRLRGESVAEARQLLAERRPATQARPVYIPGAALRPRET